MINYRDKEVQQAITTFCDDMDTIANARIELSRHEMEAWQQLRQVLLADMPKHLAPDVFDPH